MKITLINKSDATGGAAVVSLRLLEALRAAGVDARMLVAEKLNDSPFVELGASRRSIRRAFLAERLKVFMANGMSRDTLFKIDIATDGLPLWRHRWVKDADAVMLNWINQGVLSLNGISHLAALGKPIIWTMHDMWPMTGVCHHAAACRRFTSHCGECPLLGSKASATDASASTHARKQALYAKAGIHFVAVSHWLAGKAAESSLLAAQQLSVIPNAFPLSPITPTALLANRPDSGRHNILFGAARLDDPIKGLPVLIEATRLIARTKPRLAASLRLVTFGAMRDPHALDGVEIEHRHLGTVRGDETLTRLYRHASAVVSTSQYETLPGTLIEGQANGAVPVSFDSGGQADIIEHQQTGWLCRRTGDTPTDAEAIARGIEWAVGAPSSIRRAMRTSVERRFSADAVAERYISLVKSLIG